MLYVNYAYVCTVNTYNYTLFRIIMANYMNNVINLLSILNFHFSIHACIDYYY